MIEKLLRELQTELHDMWLFNYNEYVSGMCDYRIVSVDFLNDLKQSLVPISRALEMTYDLLEQMENRMDAEERMIWHELEGLLR